MKLDPGSKSGTGSGQEPEWGEFFPLEMSPFGYNESIAQSFYPLTEDETKASGWKWYHDPLDHNAEKASEIPDKISDITDDITEETLYCKVTGRGYRIQSSDLKFYHQMNLPIPDCHPDERHHQRVMLRNPRQLYDRQCQGCQTNIKTTFAPDRKESVLCEACYLGQLD